MQTKFWGPPGWDFLHSVANNYANLDWKLLEEKGMDDDMRNNYKQFFYYVGKVLPCRYCRKSYKKFYKELPIDNYLYGLDDLLYWTYCIHNKVNDKLRAQGEHDKPNPSFDEIRKKYRSHNAKSCTKKVTCKTNNTCTHVQTCMPYQKVKYASFI